MRIGVVISSSEPENAWNGFRFANLAAGRGDDVRVFLINSGVECLRDLGRFDVKTQSDRFQEKGGKVLGCGTCMATRKIGAVCEISNMDTLYQIVEETDKTIFF